MATIEEITYNTYMTRPLTEWKEVLSKECQAYILEGGGYLIKPFDQIQYHFCDKDSAKEIIVDNLYALLTSKYFNPLTDEAMERIDKIIKSFTVNLRTILPRVTFNKQLSEAYPDIKYVKYLPDGCIAFRNGVYDFRNNKWLFRYNIYKMINNIMFIEYPFDYVIYFFFNFDFEPLDIDISNTTISDFIEIMKELDKVEKNYCFELCYNMSFDSDNKFSLTKFIHLSEILGYTCLNSFSQHFVIFIGNGQNGKNSLFDGCLTSNVVPKPVSNSLDVIENDRFVTGSLEGSTHNIFLETSGKVYEDSNILKSLTGSQDQTIEHKGVPRYPGIINCKYLFAGNEKEDIKFKDTTKGFTRRINMYELFYTWDAEKKYMKRGDYYDCEFSEDLRELRSNIYNPTIYIYLAMFGMKIATKNFESTFKFTENDWSLNYSDVNTELKEMIDNITLKDILTNARRTDKQKEIFAKVFYSKSKKQIYKVPVDISDIDSDYLSSENWQEYTDSEDFTVSFKQPSSFLEAELIHNVGDEQTSIDLAYNFLTSFDELYLSVRYIYNLLDVSADICTQHMFTKFIQKIYGSDSINRVAQNNAYVRCTFKSGKIEIIK